jgi:signal transduction histidine kinase
VPDTSIAHATEHANDKSYQSVDSDTAPAEEHVAEPIQQAEQTSATPQEPVRHQQLMTETPDWALFLDPEKLQQKAGCQPHHLRQLVLREIVDNALDVGAQVTLRQEGDVWVVTDNGPGLDPAMVPELFAVNRSLRSNKARLPLRGMLGNGLRVVMGAAVASEGSLAVETRGRRLTLGVNQETGDTIVTANETIAMSPGLTVRITFGPGLLQWYSWTLAIFV